MNEILVVEDDAAVRHVLAKLLENSGYHVTTAIDGVSALAELCQKTFDLVFLDIGLPGMNGLEVLARLPQETPRPRFIVMTADDTPETLLRAVREQAYRYIRKPFTPRVIVELARDALDSGMSGPIEVLSARPDWVELQVPCDLKSAERIQGFMAQLEADLPEEVRESVGRAFRELLLNAVEWGGGFDPNRKIRIAYLRARRMLLYRITDPGTGFSMEGLSHAAIQNPFDNPTEHLRIREQKGLRPGGFGILLVKAMVDELIYNEKHNEVVFVKYLDSKPAKSRRTKQKQPGPENG